MDWVCAKLRLSQDQRERLHREISGRNLTVAGILELAREIKELYPGKQWSREEQWFPPN
jgi:hemolysin activation/secretion protein